MQDHEIKSNLKSLCRAGNLEKVSRLTIKTYLECDLLHRGCHYLSNLTSLHISRSSLYNLRFLGSTFPKIKELALPYCKLKTLDGLTSFPNVQVLCVAYNKLENVDSCIFLTKLCHLDVERNSIRSWNGVQWLAVCPALQSLILLGNPLQNDESLEVKSPHYGEYLSKIIPQLKYIDGVRLQPQKAKSETFWKRLKKSASSSKIPEKFCRSMFHFNNDTTLRNATVFTVKN